MSKPFSLTHPDPVKPQRRNDGRDYAAEAIDRWLDCQSANLDFEESYAELGAVSNRLVKGDIWLREHGPSNPKHAQAQRTHARLSRKQAVLLQEVKLRYVTIYIRVCALHGTLNMLAPEELDAWIDKNAGHLFTNDVRSIWESLQPDRMIPFKGVYPEPTQTRHIDNGFQTPEQLNQWMHRTNGETQ